MPDGSHLLSKLRSTRELPTLPAVLVPLLRYLDRPLDSQDVHEIVHLIAQDKSLAARCLQIANSPLYGCSREVESVQAAVVVMGLERIHEIAVSCSLLKLLPTLWFEISPSVFWAHSLGCALMAREFAVKIGFPDFSKAYAAGLLHDIGIVGLLAVAPREFAQAVKLAQAERIALHESEYRTLGTSHIEAGQIIAQSWHLPPEIVEVIAYHHAPEKAPGHPALASIVCVSDLLCRLSGIGHGYVEHRQTNFTEEPAFAVLAKEFQALHPFDWARFTFEMEGVVDEIRATVTQVYGATQ
jgi:putative nucleotidyltransferase with HDIG domain